jgi:hypothetical protein
MPYPNKKTCKERVWPTLHGPELQPDADRDGPFDVCFYARRGLSSIGKLSAKMI